MATMGFTLLSEVCSTFWKGKGRASPGADEPSPTDGKVCRRKGCGTGRPGLLRISTGLSGLSPENPYRPGAAEV
jgi:hypothetical protein